MPFKIPYTSLLQQIQKKMKWDAGGNTKGESTTT